MNTYEAFCARDYGSPTNHIIRETLNSIDVFIPSLFPLRPCNTLVFTESVPNVHINPKFVVSNNVTNANFLHINIARGSLLPKWLVRGDKFIFVMTDDCIQNGYLILV